MNGATGYRQCIAAAKQRLSELMHIKSSSDTVLVDNASEGINAIIRNLEPPLGPSEYILDLSTAYGPFKGLYQWLGSRYGVNVLEVPIQWPVTGPESFIKPITAALEANASTLNIRIAIISHVSAYPAVILPVNQLVELFHRYNIPVIVDGAHALGNIEINIAAMSDVDYYFTNTHKWLYASKSSAILYVRHDHQRLYVPAPAIVDSAMTDVFESRFIWTGTRDRTPYCAILSALDYRQSLGGEQRIMDYNQNLAQVGGRYLSRLWETKILSPENMQSGMTNVQVPTNNLTICQMVVGELYNTYNTMVSGASNIVPELGDIPCYLRLSAQIYQEENDWHVLGALIVKLLKQFNGYTPGENALRF
jgi:selenocysteine lyase/cysteine desulfurase